MLESFTINGTLIWSGLLMESDSGILPLEGSRSEGVSHIHASAGRPGAVSLASMAGALEPPL